MICYLLKEQKARLNDFLPCDAFGCKFLSNVQAYDLDTPFAGVWIQNDKEGNTTAALSKVEGAAVLCAKESADFEEWESFVSVVGIKTLLCQGEAAAHFCSRQKIKGPVMKRKFFLSKQLDLSIHTVQNPSLTEVYKVLLEARAFGKTAPRFEAFYVDASHRIRHGCMASAGVYVKDKLAAVAMLVAETENTALLGAVATMPQYRNRGYASQAVLTLLQGRKEKAVYLFREADKNEHFYRQLGFIECDTWCEMSW